MMTDTSSSRGFFRNALDAMMAARQRQANEYVANLARLYGDDMFEPRVARRSGKGGNHPRV